MEQNGVMDGKKHMKGCGLGTAYAVRGSLPLQPWALSKLCYAAAATTVHCSRIKRGQQHKLL